MTKEKSKQVVIEPPTIEIKGLEELKDIAYVNYLVGCIYGNCIGDAYGLATEFQSSKQVAEKYPNANEFIDFPDYITNRHNSRWDKGDWTDDTDQMITILQSFIQDNGNIKVERVAENLYGWIRNGFPDLGDISGMGIGQTVGTVVYNENFLTSPMKVSKSVWLDLKKSMAANGALMRTSATACMDFINERKVLENTIDCCKVTHYDSRCIVSCVIYTKIISDLLKHHLLNANGNKGSSNDDQVVLLDKILLGIDGEDEKYFSIAKFHFDNNKMIDESSKQENFTQLKKYMLAKEWVDLELDESTSIGYVYKCLGSAIVSIRKYSEYYKCKKDGETPSYLFRKVLDELIRQGGDADTNGAVAGALLGVIIGYSNLPQDMLLSLPNKSWLDPQLSNFIKLVDKRISNGTVAQLTIDNDQIENLKDLDYFKEDDSYPNLPKKKKLEETTTSDDNNNSKTNCSIQ